LIRLHPSQERWALKGSMHKRWVMIATKAQQVTQLQDMAEAYRQSYAVAKAMKSSTAFYPLQNLIAAEIALGWCAGSSSKKRNKRVSKELDSYFEELKSYLTVTTTGSTDFWTMVLETDYQLLKALSNRNLSGEEEQSTIKAYLSAERRGGSPKDLQSIAEHIRLFLVVARKQIADVDANNTLCASLQRLIDGLQGD
jgi:hypothetical protein